MGSMVHGVSMPNFSTGFSRKLGLNPDTSTCQISAPPNMNLIMQARNSFAISGILSLVFPFNSLYFDPKLLIFLHV